MAVDDTTHLPEGPDHAYDVRSDGAAIALRGRPSGAYAASPFLINVTASGYE